MGVILILILASLAVAGLFLAAFIWAVRSGQYDDTQTPSMRLLMEDANPGKPLSSTSPNSKTQSK